MRVIDARVCVYKDLCAREIKIDRDGERAREKKHEEERTRDKQ